MKNLFDGLKYYALGGVFVILTFLFVRKSKEKKK
jgi:hypothetical protein